MAKNADTWGWKDAEREWKRRRRKTVLELANMSDSDGRRFMRLTGNSYYDRRSFRSEPRKYRDDLRRIWAGDEEVARQAIDAWMDQTRESWPWTVVESTRHGRRFWGVYPKYDIFPLALALAVSELGPDMAVCGNPECPNRYFLKSRKTQRFCDRPACAVYGQREYKRKWWNEHGKEWKETREKTSSAKSSRQKKGGQ